MLDVPVRMKCVTLGQEALHEGLVDEPFRKQASEFREAFLEITAKQSIGACCQSRVKAGVGC